MIAKGKNERGEQLIAERHRHLPKNIEIVQKNT